jgi:predicted membrane-bound spermidine synthase
MNAASKPSSSLAPAAGSLLHVVECLFFLSGAAALMYQVCWQRILFFSFGTDIESTTIIVSVFMMGLGLGALAGGWAADRWFDKIVPLFALSELCIGLFGLVSPHLLPFASDLFILSSRGVLALVNFILLLLPTALMGGTLPMLITLCLRTYKNVGVSTGTLYCLNTLGAATGCALGSVGFKFIHLDGVIDIAAAINIFVAVTVYLKFRGSK